tara:strand:- start:7695 stop:9086 length:1392 start_codon:yes stop_codon:yes gene_type:complete
MAFSSQSQSPELVRTLARRYAELVLVLVGLVPTVAIAYLYFFQDPALRFEHYSFHELVIGLSLLQSGFIAYVTWRCYLQAGEPFLRWLTLGFLGFTVIYCLHGVFTRHSHDDMSLFIIYGPAARVTIAACLLAGLIAQGRSAHPLAHRYQRRYWLAGLSAFAVIDVLVFTLASSSWGPMSRWVMEVSALCISVICALTIAARRTRSPLMTILALSLLYFAQSSLAFLLGSTWNHMWWLAHVVFATGFMALSYGVIQAFLTSGSFTAVFSLAELMEQIRMEKVRAEDALLKLQRAHQELETLAATDLLTGAASRREFEARAVAEVARVKRSGAPLSFVVIDLDHFKEINDRHGHRGGDEVLKAFVALVQKLMRPSDLIGRLGGEEFAIMLPDITHAGAAAEAERLRQRVEVETVLIAGTHIRFTVSLGVAQYGLDGDGYESVIEFADRRMYRAKQQGRNQVGVR